MRRMLMMSLVVYDVSFRTMEGRSQAPDIVHGSGK